MPSLKPGMTFMDGYIIEKFLGEGGMGEAFLATQKKDNSRCVIKRANAVDPKNLKRLIDEAKIMARISKEHQGLPVLYTYSEGKASQEEGQTPYIVMEYIEGETLAKKKEKCKYSIRDVIQWGKDILNVLKYVHDENIIHRDIHPSNICINTSNQAVLLDFGISRRLDVMHTRTIIANFRHHDYAPIEQFESDLNPSYEEVNQYLRKLHLDGYNTGKYTDIYGLAATLYFMLTNYLPLHPYMRCMGNMDIKSPIELNPEIPVTLSRVLLKALQLHPKERYQTADDMLIAWSRIPSLPSGQVVQVQEYRKPQSITIVTPPSRLIDPVNKMGQELIFVPAGEFYMGNKELKLEPFPVELKSYYIGRYPVTNVDYKQFIDARPDWRVPCGISRRDKTYGWNAATRTYTSGLDNYPVVLIAWIDALEYLGWLAHETDHRFRLPSEAEWEKAACWDVATSQARRYPWGNEFDEDKCNTHLTSSKLMPVDHYVPHGNSPYGLVDMSGNVWEWTNTLDRHYPYRVDANLERYSEEEDRIIRGGAYTHSPKEALCASRKYEAITRRQRHIGFRIACDPIE